MAILTHGSDLSLAPTAGPIVRAGGHRVADCLKTLAGAGFRSVQLDASLPGLRPRELDRRARRDLSALLTRHALTLAGLDLFVPRRHYLDDAQADRAMAATFAAIELAADLGRCPLSLALPVDGLEAQARHEIVAAADAHGVRLAVHAEDQMSGLVDWVKTEDVSTLGAGIDPAALLALGAGPVGVIQQRNDALAVTRLSDYESGEKTRCAVGRGDLDVAGYRIGCDLAATRVGPMVLDLRGLSDPLAAAVVGHAAWEAAAPTV